MDRANEIFGINAKNLGLVWHHVENSNALILIPRDLHDAVKHTGGRATNGPWGDRARAALGL